MPLSSNILRGLAVEGWEVYQPPAQEKRNTLSGHSGSSSSSPEEEQLLPRALEQEYALLEKFKKETEKERKLALEKARQEAKKIMEAARCDGYAEGLRQAEKESRALKEEALAVLAKAEQERCSIIRGAEAEILQIALSIAEKLLNNKINFDATAVLGVLAKALETLPGGQTVTLRVNPEDESVSRKNLKWLQGLLKKEVPLHVTADPAVPLGSCKVESEEAVVELNLQVELEILAKRLLSLSRS